MLNLLEDKEKKALRYVGVVLGLVLIFLFLLALPQRKRYFSALSVLEEKERNHKYFEGIGQSREEEWHRWQEAFRDMDELKSQYFYAEKQIPQQLRIDLDQIQKKARIRASRINYRYTQFRREEIKKVSVSFNIKGPYITLKRFLLTVEELPKFLFVEKIDFLDIDSQRGILELKIVLAVYYAI